MALAIVLLTSLSTPALADTTTGNISGTVTANGQPLAGVSVAAVSPSGRYSAKTDGKGFFSIIGVQPDTYTLTFSTAGYTPSSVNGVTVSPALTATVNQALSQALKQIGSTTSRATGVSAFQPQQPIDTYSVNTQQINTILGKAHEGSETALIIALPGASLDRAGYPVLRGGRQTEEGFQYEGIDYTDALTSQFVNTLALNGVQSFQLSPGAGDASVGNAGTGQINITTKRGAHPSFGALEGDVSGPAFFHYFAGDYGAAAPDGHFSNYLSLTATNFAYQYGRPGTNPVDLGLPQTTSFERGRDFVNNTVFKFGRDSRQSLQLLYTNQLYQFYRRNYFGFNGYRVGDPVFNSQFTASTGLTVPELAKVSPLEVGQQTYGGMLNRPPYSGTQPNETIKVQYSNALDTSTYFTAKFYKVNSTDIFDFPYAGAANWARGVTGDEYSLQGGQRTGIAFDATKQVGQRHLIGLGGKYEFVHGIRTYDSASVGLYLADATGTIYDFLSSNPANPHYAPSCATTLVAAFGANPCGYLDTYFPNGAPRIPKYDIAPTTNRQDLSYYLQDQFQATDTLKISAGVRVDATTFNYPKLHEGAFNVPGGYSSGFYAPISTALTGGVPDPAKDVYADVEPLRHLSVLQPRFAAAYQVDPRDSVTFSYGRSTQLPPIAFVDSHLPRAPFAPFVGIPATQNLCGPTGDRVCRDYADELYWIGQSGGSVYTPVKPQTYNNFDASYQHDFGRGLAVKITPFYRRGYDVLAVTATQLVINGVPQFNTNGNPVLNPAQTSNNAIERTTGVELYATKTAAFGLSGSLSLTYINEFSNVVPLTPNEDFFPQIPPESLALGNLYRVGSISPFNGTLAFQYKWHNGWRVNPVVGFNIGYPYGAGLLSAYALNGKYYNLPNTNVTSPAAVGGSAIASQYVDPANPGTVFHPNIAATRGTPEKAAAGGELTAPRVTPVNLSVEYNRPGTHSTFGVLITNVFNQLYTQPQTNSRFQPVATGISGPKSGTTSGAVAFPGLGYANYGPLRSANQPYYLTPSNLPTEFRFYYQLSL